MALKTRSQRKFEAALRRERRLAHPAVPTDSSTGWETACARPGCTKTFITPTKQRRYCSDACRRTVERDRARREDRIAGLLLFECAAPRCHELFAPTDERHMFCSSRCRKRAHRASSDLSAPACAQCGAELPETRTRRMQYCGPTCRQRAARARRTTTDEGAPSA